MRISVFGLGYVGSVSAAAFAADGHHVVGVDVHPDKVDAINQGHVYRYIGNVTATWTAFTTARQTFDITALGGVDAFTDHARVNSPSTAYFESADGQPGTLVNSDVTSQYANLNLTGVHRLTASPFTATTSFGLRREYRNSDQIWNQAKNVPAGAQNIRLGLNQASTETRFQVKDMAYFVQEEFLTFNERLLLTAAVNSERSSVNGDDQKFYAYPKFSGSFRVPFSLPFTDEIKIRGAYGRAGNQPPFGWKYTTLPVSPYSGQLGGLTSTIAGNPGIKPETSQETEGGVAGYLSWRRLSGPTEPQLERRPATRGGADADRPALLGHQRPCRNEADL